MYVPLAVKELGLQSYNLPNFAHNYQNRSHDGTASRSKIYYHTGRLTGLQYVDRKSCKGPKWSFGNVTLECNVLLPHILVFYQARLQSVTPAISRGGIRRLDFNVTGEITGMEASMVVTASPHVPNAYIKHLISVDAGKPSFKFTDAEDLSYETLVSHFYHKFNEIFQEIFSDDYLKALQRAVESIPYPFEQSK